MIEWTLFGVGLAGLVVRSALAFGELLDFRIAQAVEHARATDGKLPTPKPLDIYWVALRDVLKAPIGLVLVLWGFSLGVWRLLTPDSPIPPLPREIWASLFVAMVPIGLCIKAGIDLWARRKLSEPK